MIKHIIMSLILSLALCHTVHADGLSSLIKASKDQDQMAKILKAETKTYNTVEKAVSSNEIKVGQTREFIEEKYGSPVVIMKEDTGRERWVYKPSFVSYFDNIKIYLYFSRNGKLEDIKTLKNKK